MNPARRSRSITLEQLREATACNRRLVGAAREHVGAAGLEQSAILERIVTAGREHETLNAALREVLETLHAASESGPVDLGELLRVGHEQLDIAHQFRSVVEDALSRITSTPVANISVATLEEIRQGVETQARQLQELIDAARVAVSGPERQSLGVLQHEVDSTVRTLREQEEAARVDALGAIGHDVVGQIAAQQAPTEQQVEALEQVARAALQQAEALRQADTGGANGRTE